MNTSPGSIVPLRYYFMLRLVRLGQQNFQQAWKSKQLELLILQELKTSYSAVTNYLTARFCNCSLEKDITASSYAANFGQKA